jgi:hypothetical protein
MSEGIDAPYPPREGSGRPQRMPDMVLGSPTLVTPDGTVVKRKEIYPYGKPGEVIKREKIEDRRDLRDPEEVGRETLERRARARSVDNGTDPALSD